MDGYGLKRGDPGGKVARFANWTQAGSDQPRLGRLDEGV